MSLWLHLELMHSLNFMCNFRHNCGKQQKQHASGHNLSQFYDIKCMYSGWILVSMITSFSQNDVQLHTQINEPRWRSHCSNRGWWWWSTSPPNIWPLAQNKSSALLNSCVLKEHLLLQLSIWTVFPPWPAPNLKTKKKL